jgi:hypothetical protein
MWIGLTQQVDIGIAIARVRKGVGKAGVFPLGDLVWKTIREGRSPRIHRYRSLHLVHIHRDTPTLFVLFCNFILCEISFIFFVIVLLVIWLATLKVSLVLFLTLIFS